MNKSKFKETIRFAFWGTVEDHPAAIIASFIGIGTLLIVFILTSPILTALALIIVFLLPPIISTISFIRNYYWYKERSLND